MRDAPRVLESAPAIRGSIGHSARLGAIVALVVGSIALTAPAPRGTPFVASGAQSTATDSAPTGADYFGLHIHRAVSLRAGEPQSTWPDIGFGSWRLWDAHVAWTDLEPARGRWDFTRLDSCVELARRHNVRVLLTLGLTPRWASSRPDESSNYGPGNQAPPADILDWSRYVDTLAKRYRGRIEAYEIWNEPNLRGFYSGTPRELARLASAAYSIIKSVDSAAIVVTPSATGVPGGADWLHQYLAEGGGDHADVVGFHFYVTPGEPEAMLASIATVRQLLSASGHGELPLWNTESGWLMQNEDVRVEPSGAAGTFGSRVLDFDTSAAFVARALLLGRCGGLRRFYWYAWDNRRMGLIDADGRTKKKAATAYATTRRWLVGSRVESCESRSDGTWAVRIRRADGSRGVIAWSTDGARTITLLPAGSRVRATESVLGPRHGYTTRRAFAVVVTSLPTLFLLS